MSEYTRARLNGIKALAEEYRPTMDIEVVHDWAGEAVKNTFDAEAALTEVLDLHPSIDGAGVECDVCADDRGPKPYPCPTVRAITEKLGR